MSGAVVNERLRAPKSEALRGLFWRSEILQVMYWLRGEGLGDEVTPAVIDRFLGVDAAIAVTYLDRLVEDGHLTREGEAYALSAAGAAEGAEEFEAAFAELTRPAHGECSADCWCQTSIEEAEACAAERAGHAPGGPTDR
jgi:hypothetical protein